LPSTLAQIEVWYLAMIVSFTELHLDILDLLQAFLDLLFGLFDVRQNLFILEASWGEFIFIFILKGFMQSFCRQ
jgi:hypothetical protein